MTQTVFASYDHMALVADYHTPELHAHLCSHLAVSCSGKLCGIGAGETIEADGVFIDSGVNHTIEAPGEMLLFFFDNTSAIGRQVKARYMDGGALVAAPEALVTAMRASLADFARTRDPLAFDRATLESLLPEEDLRPAHSLDSIDPRVAETLGAIASWDRIDHDALDELSKRACLSKSRLSHLFTQQMGISLHRYLAFSKMRKAAEYIAAGNTLTDAALRAGFDSSSHLSSTVKRMFGISLTEVMRTMQ